MTTYGHHEMTDDEKKTFEEQIVKVMHAAGLMSERYTEMFGKKLWLLADPKIDEHGIDVTYSYYEQAGWENAGYSKNENRICSGKVGDMWFRRAMCALYYLQGIYQGGPVNVDVNGYLEYERPYIGWLNYILDTRFPRQDNDLWKKYEIGQNLRANWAAMDDGTSGLSGLEVYAVTHDNLQFISHLLQNDEFEDYIRHYLELKFSLIKYKENSTRPVNEQIDALMNVLHKLYQGEESEDLQDIQEHARLCYMPAAVVQLIADVYQRNFWGLWKRIKLVANAYRETIVPVSRSRPLVKTEDFFRCNNALFVATWSKDKPVIFTDETKMWFEEIRGRYDKLTDEGVQLDKPVRFLIDTLADAGKFYRVKGFKQFVEETIDYPDDNRLHVLWKMFEEMVHDPHNIELNNWKVPGTNFDDDFLNQWYPCYPIREKLQNFMALCANTELREVVFDFSK